MRKLFLLPAAALLAFTAGCTDAPTAVGNASPSFQNQGGGNPKISQNNCYQSGNNVVCEGRVTGVGNLQLTVRVSAVGTADVLCTNPGGQRVEAQDQTITATGSGSVIEDTNGNFIYDVVASPSASNVCPNGRWSFQLTNVQYTSATVSLVRGGTVFDQETDTNLSS